MQLLPANSTAEAVLEVEQKLSMQPQVNLQTEMLLSARMVARTIHIPAGTGLVGCCHKTDHINIVSGDITVTTDQGERRFTGYHVLSTRAGSKRIGYAHADTKWTTICRNDFPVGTPLAEIEDALVEDSYKLQTRQPALAAASEPLLES